MKLVYTILFNLMLFATTMSVALADCIKDGKTYSEGTVIGGFICTAEGKWKKE